MLDERDSLIYLLYFPWMEKDYAEIVNLADMSAKSGTNWTSTGFYPSLVIFHNASIVFPTFENPMLRKGSN